MLRNDGIRTAGRRKKAAFAAALLVLFAAGAEMVFRIAMPDLDWDRAREGLRPGPFSRWDGGYVLTYIYDPDYNFRLAPGTLRGPAPVTINALGLKGPLPAREKKPGTVRILVLGGSAAFQFTRRDGMSWPDLLGRKLSDRAGTEVEIINAATPGYTAYQSSRRLEVELIAYRPDLVIVSHLWNDLKLFALSDPGATVREWEALAPRGREFDGRGRTPMLDQISRQSRAIAYIRVRTLAARLERARGAQEGRAYQSTGHKISPAGPVFYRQNLERIVRITSERGTPLVIVKQPTLVRPDNTAEERARIRYQYAGFGHPVLAEAYRAGWRINDELCRHDLVYCVPANELLPGGVEYFSDQVHLTAAGREALADLLDRALAEIFGDLNGLAAM